MRDYVSRNLVGTVVLLALSQPPGAGAAHAQQPPAKSDTKDEAKKKEAEAKKKEAEAKKREEAAKKFAAAVAEQKKMAQANWDALGIGEPASRETQNLLLYAPKAYAMRLAEAGIVLDKFYALAHQALGIKPEAPPWPGKMTVYLFPKREQYTSFRRRVEKRKVEPEDTCSFQLGDAPHVAASPPQSTGDASIEGQAGEQLAMAMITKESEGFKIPDWLLKGFGRATYYRVFPSTQITLSERRLIQTMVRQNTANVQPIFNNQIGQDRTTGFRGCLTDFMAYGPGNPKFPAFVAAFKPDKEKKEQMRNTIQALKEVALEPEGLKKAWHAWVALGAR
jgi:hypothetical protein